MMFGETTALARSRSGSAAARIVTPFIEITRDGALVQSVVVTQACLTVGTAPDADIVLNLPGVQPQHLSIQLTGDLSLEALNVALDPDVTHEGAPFRRVRLREGSEIELAGYIFRLSYTEPEQLATPRVVTHEDIHPSMAPTVLEYRPTLHALGPDSQCAAVRLRPGRYVVGTEECEILVPYQGVARQHAALTVHAEGYVEVENLRGGEATCINRRPIARSRLHPGDVLQIGSMVFSLQSTADVAARPVAQLREVPRAVETAEAKHAEPEPAKSRPEPSPLMEVPPPKTTVLGPTTTAVAPDPPPATSMAPPSAPRLRPVPTPSDAPAPPAVTVVPPEAPVPTPVPSRPTSPRPLRAVGISVAPTTAIEIVALFEPEPDDAEAEFLADLFRARRRQLAVTGAAGLVLLAVVGFFAAWQLWLSFEHRRNARQFDNREASSWVVPASLGAATADPSAVRATPSLVRMDADSRSRIDVTVVEEILGGSVMPDARTCYRHRLDDNPRLAGTMMLDLVIGTDGRVSDVALDSSASTLGDGALLKCVREVVQTHEFPAAIGEPVTIRYPFLFH